MKTCSTKGCGRKRHARGLCRRCYQRHWWRGTFVSRPQKTGLSPCNRCGRTRRHKARGLCNSCYCLWWQRSTAKGLASSRKWKRHSYYKDVDKTRARKRAEARVAYRRHRVERLSRLRVERESLADWYVATRLDRRTTSAKKFPSVLLEAKRAQLKLHRLVKESA